jgi:hypothetical protein
MFPSLLVSFSNLPDVNLLWSDSLTVLTIYRVPRGQERETKSAELGLRCNMTLTLREQMVSIPPQCVQIGHRPRTF